MSRKTFNHNPGNEKTPCGRRRVQSLGIYTLNRVSDDTNLPVNSKIFDIPVVGEKSPPMK